MSRSDGDGEMGAPCSKPRTRPDAPAAPKPNGAADSPFFALPPELRRAVLIAAFGGRTLHPQQPSCVCRSLHLKYPTANPAADDWCVPRMQRDLVGLREKTWIIGAMGWLQACRQAYVEGVDVLYGTNTFHVWTCDLDHNPLVDHFPAFSLPLIKSLEWVIDPYPWVQSEREVSRPRSEVVRALPITALPNLEKLYLGFRDMEHMWECFRGDLPVHPSRNSPAKKYQIYTERILMPLDALISTGIADGVRHLEVGVPMSAFHAHLKKGMDQGAKVEKVVAGWNEHSIRGTWSAWGPRQRIWRSVGDGEDGKRGYWLAESCSDVSYGFPDRAGVYWT